MARENDLNLKATELRLGLPGSDECDDVVSAVKSNKRASPETAEDSASNGVPAKSDHHETAPAPKAQLSSTTSPLLLGKSEVVTFMGNKEKARERREKRREEITLLRTLPYSDNQRWWTSNTIAVVTGANRGIGYEIAHQLALHGLTVILTSRDVILGEAAATVLQERGLEVVYCQLDIVDPSSIEAFSTWIKEVYGGIDILINSAGVNFNLGSDNSVEHAEEVIATNYFGTKNMIKTMIPLMQRSSSGARIVNVGSRLGRLNGRRNRIGNIDLRRKLEDDESLSEELIDQTMNTFLEEVKNGSWEKGGWPQVYTDYSLSKLAVHAYTRLVARTLSEQPEGQKIYINCCCPGWVKTAMTGWAGHTSPEEGADTAVWLALLQDQTENGKFFAERRLINF